MVAAAIRRKRRRATPLDRTVEVARVVNEPALPDPPDLATLPEDLHYRRELSYARAAANRFAGWLAEHVARERIPMDDVSIPVKLLGLFVLESLIVRVRYPHLYPAPEPAQDEFWTPQTEAEASEVGLTVRRVRRGETRPPANLPGCAGEGGRCPQFRRFGERFCSHHRRLELERIRGG